MRGVTDRWSERLHDAGQGCAGPRLPPALASSACREYEFGGLTRSVPQLPQFPSVFPLWWIAGTASVGAILSFLVLRFASKRLGLAALSIGQTLVASVVVGLSILAWRLSGNIPELNDDPIGALSPNDWLCPVVTYVFLGVYGAFGLPASLSGWQRSRPPWQSFRSQSTSSRSERRSF